MPGEGQRGGDFYGRPIYSHPVKPCSRVREGDGGYHTHEGEDGSQFGKREASSHGLQLGGAPVQCRHPKSATATEKMRASPPNTPRRKAQDCTPVRAAPMDGAPRTTR